MKVYGNKGLEILFPKCEYVENIKDAKVVYLVTDTQFATRNDSYYFPVTNDSFGTYGSTYDRYAEIKKLIEARDKEPHREVAYNEDLRGQLNEILAQMSQDQLLIVCGGFAGAYASLHDLTIGVTDRNQMASYSIKLGGYMYNVVGNQASVILANGKAGTIIAKSESHLKTFLKGFDTNTVNQYGEAEMIYFKPANGPKCVAFQFFPDFYPKAPIIPKLVSRIKKYIQ